MNGRNFFIGFFIFLAVFGGGLYYALNYAYYDYVEESEYTLALDDAGGELALRNVERVHGSSSPLKFRICADEVALDSYKSAEAATPLVAPRWFKCFDAETLQAALDNQNAQANILASNQPYGFDVIAMNYEGRSYIWRQLNECGEARFSGDPLPENCPRIAN